MFEPASPEQAMLRQQFLESKETTAWLRFSMAGCATIAVYDILITLSDEIELVWKRNLWTFPALLYFGNRYVTLATVLLTSYTVSPFHSSSSDAVCRQAVSLAGFSIGLASWGGIMALRVTALWKGRRPIVWLVWMTWMSMVLAMTTGVIVVYVSMLPTLRYDHDLGICTGTSTLHIQAALPAIQSAFVMIVTILTVVKAYQFGSPLRNLGGVSSMMNLMLTDGIICLLVVSILSFASGISWMILEPGMNRVYLPVYISWTIYSSLVSRLFLRLRKMFYKSRSTVGCATRHSTTTTTTTTTTAMTPNPELDHVINNGIESGFFRDNEFAILSVQHQNTSTEGAHRGIRDSESFWCSPTSSARGTIPLSIRGSALPGSFLPNLGSIPHTPTRPSAAQQSQGCSHENSYASSWCSCYSHSSALESTNGRPSTAGTGHSITIVNTRPITGILGTASTNSPIVPTFGSVSAMLAKPPRPPFHRNPPVPFPRFGIRRPSTSPTPAIGLRGNVGSTWTEASVSSNPLNVDSRPIGLSPPPRPRNRLVPTARATAVIRPHTAPAVKATVFVELYRSED